MPPVSQAQRRWAWANKDKGGEEGAAAAEYAAADLGGKLPARAKPKKSKAKKKRKPNADGLVKYAKSLHKRFR